MPRSSVVLISLSNFRIWTHLGWRDLRAQYARTKFGPWWSAASLAAIVAGSSIAIGLVGDNKALTLAPRLGIGLAIWTLISTSLSEGADLFETDRSLLLNSTLDTMSLVFRVIWRNAIIFAHNLPVVAIALWLGDYTITWHLILFLPLTALVLPALILPVAIFARLTLWRRDLKSLLPSIIQVGFFLTPILWSPAKTGPMTIVFNLNPAAWFIELIKEAVLSNNLRTDLLIRCLIVVFVSLCFSELFKPGFRNVRKLI